MQPLLSLEDYDGKLDPTAMRFDGLYVWAQIHKLPNLYRLVGVVDQLARRIGRVKEVHHVRGMIPIVRNRGTNKGMI